MLQGGDAEAQYVSGDTDITFIGLRLTGWTEQLMFEGETTSRCVGVRIGSSNSNWHRLFRKTPTHVL